MGSPASNSPPPSRKQLIDHSAHLQHPPAMSIPPPATVPRQESPRVIDPEWEAIMARGEEPEVPEWHREVLDQVEREIAAGTAIFIPWEEMKAQLQKEFPNT